MGRVLAELSEWIAGLVAANERCLLGLAGPPGCGKSTVAGQIAESYGDDAVLVPMDGFHLAQEVLDRAGTASRKGAPFTFDGAGFVALLHRIRAMQPGATVYAPRFDRAIENPIAGAIPITAAHRLVVIEGNYLLLDEPPWDEVRELVAERIEA